VIFKRTVARLRAQDWLAIAIEVGIVIIGVFVGNQVSNWNNDRAEQRENVQILRNLKPETRAMIDNFGTIERYYTITRHYADTAFAGWRSDPAVSDREFVIAAYQASQNTLTGINSDTWSQIFGSDRLRSLHDRELREELSVLMTTDYKALESELNTPYRQHVRQVIPEDIQDAIRANCGDQRVSGTSGFLRLPPTCSLDLPDERFREGASALRDHPELVGEMRWHFAAVASYVNNIKNLQRIALSVKKRVDLI
jgi:hypothetical protein